MIYFYHCSDTKDFLFKILSGILSSFCGLLTETMGAVYKKAIFLFSSHPHKGEQSA